MDELLGSGFAFWGWWVLGFVLLVVEVLTPGMFCMWIGFAAFGTGIVAWLIPSLPGPVEVVIFALLTLVSVGLWFKIRPTRKGDDVNNGLNQRGRGYIGRVLTLSEGIVNGIGTARLEDSVWRVAGPNLPTGARVLVTGTEGTTLRVEAAPEQSH